MKSLKQNGYVKVTPLPTCGSRAEREVIAQFTPAPFQS
jgi:hypothetical protein